MDTVRIKDPEDMNVLGLLMKGFLSNALAEPTLEKRAKGMSGNVHLGAGKMWATLCFDGEGIEIVRGKTEASKASVRDGGALPGGQDQDRRQSILPVEDAAHPDTQELDLI